MGKHERQEIESAEKILIDLLNQKYLSNNQSRNKWIEHCSELEKVIRRDFGKIKSAEHIGNIYGKGEIGDIKILTEKNTKWLYIELKMSETPKGKGTLANISQDALTTSKLFSGSKIISWNNFRKKKKFDQKVIDGLNTYKNYPDSFNRGSINTQISKKAAFLKIKVQKFLGLSSKTGISNIVCNYINTKGLAEIAQICCNIINMARKDKISYLNYINSFPQNKNNIKKFTIAMLIGYHIRAQLKHILNIQYQEILKILESYHVYYTNEISGKIKVSSDDLGKDISQVMQGNIRIEFPKDQTNCLIKSNNKNLLRIVYHWKNKFQGIETPCLNIFKEI